MPNSRVLAGCMLLAFAACSVPQFEIRETGGTELIYQEDFEGFRNGDLPDDWWVEGGESVQIRDGRLEIRADPEAERGAGFVATIWNKRQFEGDVQVDFDAHTIASSLDVNNINFFLHFTHSDPERTIAATRHLRLDGGYGHYHDLNGYIFTFVNARGTGEEQARFRMRRCPGFELVDEAFTYHARKGHTYHVRITKRGNRLTYAVDGRPLLDATDDKYNWEGGLMGIRTFHTDLWIDNIQVRRPTD